MRLVSRNEESVLAFRCPAPSKGPAPLKGISRLLPALLLVALPALFLTHLAAGREQFAPHASFSTFASRSELWSDSQTINPAGLLQEISEAKAANRPTVVCTGLPELYRGAHIPGAIHHGPASNPEALDNLRKWAQGIPRASSVVIYCGCCPFDKCPNVRPAFEALRTMGFRHLRVLALPTSFAKDWVAQSYPIEKGQPAPPSAH